MPATIEDYAKIKENQAALQGQVGAFTGASTSLSGMVMDAVRKDRAARGISQMATDVGNTEGQLVTDTTGIVQRAGNMIAPSDVNQLTAGQRGQNLRTLATEATQSEYNQGQIKDVIGEHANNLLAIAQQKQQEANLAATEAEKVKTQLDYQMEQQAQAWKQYMDQENLKVAWANATNKGGTTNFDNFLKLYNALKPTAGQENQAIQAGSGKTSLAQARAIIEKNPNALYWATQKGAMGSIGTFLSGNNEDVANLRTYIGNATDAVMRNRTGAALNAQEEEFYNKLVADPWSAIATGTKSTEESFKLLDSIFDAEMKVGRDPREILTGDLSSITDYNTSQLSQDQKDMIDRYLPDKNKEKK
jgi:hypothetical protein